MQRRYVLLSLTVCILSFQAISADDSKPTTLEKSDLARSETNIQNHIDDVVLGCSELPLNDNVDGETVFGWLKTIISHNDGLCKNFGADSDYEKCADLTARRQKLIQTRAYLLLKAADDAKTGYGITRLLEFNKPIMLQSFTTLLEKKLSTINSITGEKEELELLLAHYTNKRGYELVGMFKPYLVKQENKEIEVDEQGRKEKDFLKFFIDNFSIYYKAHIHATFAKNLKSYTAK